MFLRHKDYHPINLNRGYMVSAPRQPIAAGISLLTRFDASIRPYWLRDWQSGFGGYTKVYEYQVDGQTKRMYSVAHVVRPRTATTGACLCFTFMSTLPDRKPWKRSAGQKDPSRSIILDLRDAQNWRLPATFLTPGDDIAEILPMTCKYNARCQSRAVQSGHTGQCPR